MIDDLDSYSDEVLEFLKLHAPEWHAAITEKLQRRAEQRRMWNSASLLAKQYKTAREWRLTVGYSANEEARGFDDWESDQHHEMWKRIRFLRKRSLRRMNRRHRSRSTK
jgi:hypothetical protein